MFNDQNFLFVPEVASEIQIRKPLKTDKLFFSYLPGFAKYIRDNHLVPYIQEQIRISREIDLPMLRFFEGVPDDQLIAMAIDSHREFLTAAEENTLKAHLEKSLEMWIADGLGIMKRDEI